MDPEDVVVSANPEPETPATEPVASPEPETTPTPIEIELPPFTLDEPSSTPASDNEPAAPTVSEEDIARYLQTKGHDDLKHIPAYNSTVQKAISKYRQDQNQAAQANYEMARWDQWFRQLTPAQLAQAREDPGYDDKYIKLREWRNSGSPVGGMTREQVATDMVSGLHRYFSADDRFKDVVAGWDDLTQISDPAEFMTRAIDIGMKKREKEILKAAETKATAIIKDTLAKYHITVPSPQTAKQAPAAGSGGLTYEWYLNATPEQVLKIPPAEIDKMLADHKSRK